MINPRQMQRAMERLGIQQQDLHASQVIIKLEDKDIIIASPHVLRINAMGEIAFQISGEVHEQPRARECSTEDIRMVMEQAKITESEARERLQKSKGDIAAAILYKQDL